MDINEYISSGIIEMYVMGLCSAEEKQEMETLRPKFPALNKAILQYEIELEEKMHQSVKLPSRETDNKILQNLDALRPPVISFDSVKKDKNSFFWLRSVAASAILLLAISLYLNYKQYTKSNKQEQLADSQNGKESIKTLPLADYNIMKEPTITPVAMYGVGFHAICRCTMFWDKKTGRIYIMIHHLPQSSSSRDYQLWAMVDGKPVNVGIIKDEIRGRFIEMKNVPNEATAFTVTLEKAGGTNTPTIEETYLSGEI
jgi:anti-sigma-K factor RskA